MDNQIIDHKIQSMKDPIKQMDIQSQKEFKYIPPTYFKITILATIIIAFFFPYPSILQVPLRYLGVIPILFGLIIMLWAHQIFQNQNTAIRPDDKPSKLITEGPFKISRHPMYLGFILISLGLGVILGSLFSLVATITLFLILHYKFVSYEENKMIEIFSNQYLDYKHTVRKWI